MLNMKAVIKALCPTIGHRGAAHHDPRLAPKAGIFQSIGADGYGKDAPGAVVTAKQLVAQLA